MKVRCDAAHPAWAPLQQLVRVLADPVNVLQPALVDVPGIQVAYIYGSFASHTERADSDIDVIVIGQHLDARLLARRTLDVGALIGRDINVLEVTPENLAAKVALGRRFFHSVLKGPKRWVIGSPTELPASIQSILAA
ncbi:MAG: nucleotidyltransferase domain-containing protein [Gemmatimonadaceae bacterium]